MATRKLITIKANNLIVLNFQEGTRLTLNVSYEIFVVLRDKMLSIQIRIQGIMKLNSNTFLKATNAIEYIKAKRFISITTEIKYKT